MMPTAKAILRRKPPPFFPPGEYPLEDEHRQHDPEKVLSEIES